ncbi:MAG: hypothetical protein IT433_08165 [Phycisphaerales bacterium]|nr:hypothetical protein [Phycisphaerales bacterium]
MAPPDPSSPARPSTMVLCDADIPGIVAACATREGEPAAPEAPWPLLMPFPASDPLAASREHACLRVAELLSFRITPPPAPIPARTVGESECHDLMAAAFIAAALGCDSLIWPAHAGRGDSVDIDRLAQIQDRAALIARIVSLESRGLTGTQFTILTPVADLTDHQLAELAADLAAPVDAAWWAARAGNSPEADATASRWEPLLLDAGLRMGPARSKQR